MRHHASSALLGISKFLTEITPYYECKLLDTRKYWIFPKTSDFSHLFRWENVHQKTCPMEKSAMYVCLLLGRNSPCVPSVHILQANASCKISEKSSPYLHCNTEGVILIISCSCFIHCQPFPISKDLVWLYNLYNIYVKTKMDTTIWSVLSSILLNCLKWQMGKVFGSFFTGCFLV